MTFDTSMILPGLIILAGLGFLPGYIALERAGEARQDRQREERWRFQSLAYGWPEIRTTPLAPAGGPAWTRFGPAPDDEILARVPRDSQAAWALAAMKAEDPEFSIEAFLRGATAAFAEIVTGLDLGRVEQLRPYLSADAFKLFEAHLRAREAARVRSTCTLQGVLGATIRDARYRGETGHGQIAITFTYEGVRNGLDPKGQALSTNGSEPTRQGITLVLARYVRGLTPDWVVTATDPTGFALLEERRGRWAAGGTSGGTDGVSGDGSDGDSDGGGDGGGGGDSGGCGGGD